MKKEREDRRVRLTKQAIRESLVDLMQEKPIAKISVKMLCEMADINRSTFYAHYSDQYDLLKQIQQEVVDEIIEQVYTGNFTGQSDQAMADLLRIFEYARENAALFKVLLSEHGDFSFQNVLMRIVQEKTIEEIREDKRLEPRVSKYLEIFAIYGCVSILREWLNDGCVDEPAMMAEFIMKLLFQGLMAFYR